jgi:hypothetical protein
VATDVEHAGATETGVMNHRGLTCTLHLARGVVEPCTGDRCVFWEPGGAVVRGGCLIQRLGVEVRRPDVASYLLEMRERLEQARDRLEADAAHRELSRGIGQEL